MELTKIIELHEKTLLNHTVKEYLVQWRHLSPNDVMWEGEHILQHLALPFLEEKKNLGQEDCNVLIIK